MKKGRSLLLSFGFVFIFLTVSVVSSVCYAETVVKLGIVTTPGAAQYIAAAKFKELFEARTNGEYKVKLFHSGALGNETEILQQVQMQAVDMAIITAGPFDSFVPETKVVAFPFMFRDYAQVDEVLDGPLGQEVLDRLEGAGFKGLAFSENGFRNLTNNIRPVHTVGDVQGLKIRVMESQLHKDLWRLLGANPTPMGWPIYTELQQGAIDGQENPLSVIWVYKLFEVQKHLSLTGHVYSAHIDIANLQWFNSLPAEIQETLQKSMYDAAVYQRRWNRDNEAMFLQNLKSKGMLVDEKPDLVSFRARVEQLKDSDLFSEPNTKLLLEKFLAATK